MKMKTALMVLVLASLPGTILAAEVMRDGMWQITTTMDMPGMPFKLPPTTIKHCYTKEDVADQKNVISTDKSCTVTDLKTSGNKVKWKMKCTGKNAGTFTGETVFSGDAYDSIMTMQADKGGGAPMTMNMKGKRLGNCP